MTEDYFIIVAVTVASIVSIFYIPKKDYRLALLSFLVSQVISWPQPLIFVQIGYVEFPIRDFPHATGVNVAILYLFMPMIFTWFMLLFPQSASVQRKIIHYFIFTSIVTWFIYYMSTYINLEKFLKGTVLFNIAFAYLRVSVYMFLSRLFIKWFSKRTDVLAGVLNA